MRLDVGPPPDAVRLWLPPLSALCMASSTDVAVLSSLCGGAAHLGVGKGRAVLPLFLLSMTLVVLAAHLPALLIAPR